MTAHSLGLTTRQLLFAANVYKIRELPHRGGKNPRKSGTYIHWRDTCQVQRKAGKGVLGDERGVDARFKRLMLRQFHLRDGNDGHRRFGDGGKFRLSVVLERVAQEIVFRCGETVFIDGSIVVVGGDVRPLCVAKIRKNFNYGNFFVPCKCDFR